MKLLFLLISTFCCVFICCNRQSSDVSKNNIPIKTSIENERTITYNKSISFFDNSLVDHFPKKIDDAFAVISNVFDESGADVKSFCPRVLICYKEYSYDDYNLIRNRSLKIAQSNHSPNDSNLLIVFPYIKDYIEENIKYSEFDSKKLELLSIRNTQKPISYPVPLFDIQDFIADTYCGLNSDFSILIFDAKKGAYIKDKYLSTECECVPLDWKHGYSKGIAINDKINTIIYWIIAW